jgi:hypothetical protein
MVGGLDPSNISRKIGPSLREPGFHGVPLKELLIILETEVCGLLKPQAICLGIWLLR